MRLPFPQSWYMEGEEQLLLFRPLSALRNIFKNLNISTTKAPMDNCDIDNSYRIRPFIRP